MGSKNKWNCSWRYNQYFNGLSFARLNYQYPVNDAEYSFLEILRNKEKKNQINLLNYLHNRRFNYGCLC